MNDSTRVIRRPPRARRARPRTGRTAAAIIATTGLALLAAACGGSSPSADSGGSSKTGASTSSSALAYSRCMRSHGVSSFPDPTNSGEIPKAQVVPLASSPRFQPAANTCQHLNPNGGSGQSAAQRRAHTAALLAFARCLRRHGFANVPDPTSSGQLTPEMLAQVGINLHQPAVLQAADACVGVTHGALTTADVARALNESNAAGQ